MRSEVKVGVFVFLALVMLFILSTQVNELSSSSSDGYPVHIALNDASGLEKYAKVKMSGVEIGSVESIGLKNNKPLVTLLIFKGIKLPVDSTVVLAQESMLGGRYIDIKPGDATEDIAAGGELKKQKIYASFDQTSDKIYQAAEDFRSFVNEARDVLNEQSRENLKQSFANLKDLTENFNSILESNRQNIDSVILEMKAMAQNLAVAGQKFGAMSDKFSVSADTINDKLPTIMSKLDDTVNRADSVLKDNSKPLNETIVSAKRFFDKGGDAFKKIDDMVGGVSKSRLDMGFRAEQFTAYGNSAKGYFDVTYQPSPTRYYIGSVISAPDYSKVDANDQVIKPTRYTSTKIYYSAQIGKRYNNLLFRAGLIESTGGGGVDYFMYDDDFKASLEMYDVSSYNDKRGVNPHMKFSLRYTLLEHLDLYTGYDNFLNQKADSFFFGAGLRFVADDIKSLVTGSAISAAK